MKTNIIVRLGYNHIFKQKRSIKSIQKGVDLKDALLFLSSLNKYEYKLRQTDNGELKFILNQWLIDNNIKLKKRIISAYAKHVRKTYKESKIFTSLKSVVLINRISTLRVMEVLCANHNISGQKSKIGLAKSRENLLRLYLLINDEIAERENIVFKNHFTKDPDYLDDIKLHLLIGVLQPFHHYYRINILQPEIYKFLLFEKWFRNNDYYKRLLDEYLDKIGLDNWYQYFSDVFKIAQLATNSNIISFKDYPFLKKLVEHLIIGTSNDPSWSEFIHIRKNPIIQIDENNYAIMDFEFLLNKFFSSLYHDILNFSKEKNFHRFSQDYVKEFIEEILLENAFRTSFGTSYIQLSEKRINDLAKSNISNLGIPDYYLRNGNSVIIFECKNSFISNDYKKSLNTESLLTDLRDKFYYSTNKKTKKRKSKAVIQLLNFIINSIDGKYRFFDGLKNPHNLNYYPVVIVTDDTLTSLGFNQLLNYYFQKELKQSKIEKKYKVKPLTIIHIDDFFIHQNRLRKLPKLICDYHKFLKTKILFDSMISFSDYLNTIKYQKNLKMQKKNVKHIIDDSLLPIE